MSLDDHYEIRSRDVFPRDLDTGGGEETRGEGSHEELKEHDGGDGIEAGQSSAEDQKSIWIESFKQNLTGWRGMRTWQWLVGAEAHNKMHLCLNFITLLNLVYMKSHSKKNLYIYSIATSSHYSKYFLKKTVLKQNRINIYINIKCLDFLAEHYILYSSSQKFYNISHERLIFTCLITNTSSGKPRLVLQFCFGIPTATTAQ